MRRKVKGQRPPAGQYFSISSLLGSGSYWSYYAVDKSQHRLSRCLAKPGGLRSGREVESQGGENVDAAEHRAFDPVGLAVEGDEARHGHGGEPVATIVPDVAGGAVQTIYQVATRKAVQRKSDPVALIV